MYDNLRRAFKVNIGDIAIGSAWQVSKFSQNQLLVSPGEAFFDGLPFELRSGEDWLLTAGILPTGVSLSDAPSGTGKLLTFSLASTPTLNYRIVITASEQIITNVQDPFLQNVNVPEPTSSKIRLIYTINVVSANASSPVFQGQSPNYDTSSPIPYQGEAASVDSNLSNTIQVNPNGTAGYLVSIVTLSGSEQIDGRSAELIIKNPSGANPLPNGTVDQAQYENGTLIDVYGNEYHINAIFNDTVSNQVRIRVSYEVGQSAPVIPDSGGSPSGFIPYYIKKQEVYYGSDTTGAPTGSLHWHIANANWDTTSGFVHSSVVQDLRNRVISEQDFEDITNAKFDLVLTNGGAIGLDADNQTLSWSDQFQIINPSGQPQTIDPNTVVILDGGSVVYSTNLFSNTPVTLGLGNLEVTVASSGSSLTLSGSPSLTTVSVGNVVALNTVSDTFAPGDVNTGTDRITITGHGFRNGDIVVFTTTGTLPSGLTANVPYYLINTTTNDFQVSLDLSNSPIALGTQGTGIHTAWTKFTAATSITAVDDVNKVLTLASSLSGTGPAIIFRDSYGANTAPTKENIFTLAVRSGTQVVVGGRLELAGGQNNVIYDERILFPSGLPAGTPILIPTNARNLNRQQYYDNSNRSLEVFVNQLIKTQSPDDNGNPADWSAVDTSHVSFLFDLPNNTEVRFRDDSLPAGPLGGTTGGGGSTSLQQAYNAGNAITVLTGVPVTINGPVGQKLLQVNGDVDITGVIDPAGLQLDPQTVNPLAAGQSGIWADTSGNLIHQQTATSHNITTDISTLQTDVANLQSGTSIPRDPAGAVGLSGSGLKVNVDGSTVEIATNALTVLSSPKIQIVTTAGQSFLANTTYAVRWAFPSNSETTGAVYVADAAVANDNNYLVVGLLLSTSALTATDPAIVVTNGLYTLGTSDTPFITSDIGQAVYLKDDGSGGLTTTAPITVGSVQVRIGIVQSATTVWVDLKQIDAVVLEPTYDERTLFPSGLAANTPITIPVNSRNGSAQESYNFNAADLKIFVNQLFKFPGSSADWNFVTSSTSDTQVQFNFDLPNDAEVHFRKDPLASGVLTGSGGGGGSETLQQAYNNGSTITTTLGVPFTVNGAATKVAVFTGDIEVTGVVDPTAVQLSPQGSNPLGASQAGIWVDTSGLLMHTDGTAVTNISNVINEVVQGTAQTTISNVYANTTGSTIPAFAPVYTPTSGHVGPADGTDSNKFQVIGITTESIADSAAGMVAYTGYLTGVTGLTHGVYVYLGLTPGTLTDTPPSLGTYPAGFEVVKIGIMDGTNLILQIQHIGTL